MLFERAEAAHSWAIPLLRSLQSRASKSHLITRDPGSEETFDVIQNLSEQKVRLIARRWIRAEHRSDKNASMFDKKLWSDADISNKEITARAHMVRTSLTQLGAFGINFGFDDLEIAVVGTIILMILSVIAVKLPLAYIARAKGDRR